MYFINLILISLKSPNVIFFSFWFIILFTYFILLFVLSYHKQISEDNFQDDSKKLDFIKDFKTYLDEDKTKDSKSTIKKPILKLKLSTESLIEHPNRIYNLDSVSYLHLAIIVIFLIWMIPNIKDLESSLNLIIYFSYCIIFTGIPILLFRFSLKKNLINIERSIEFLKEEYNEYQTSIEREFSSVVEKDTIDEEDLKNILKNLQDWTNSYWGYPYKKEEINILAQEFHTFIYDVNELEKWALLFKKLTNKIEIEKILKKTEFEDEKILKILSKLNDQLRFEINQKKNKINIEFRRNELFISALALLISFGAFLISIF